MAQWGRLVDRATPGKAYLSPHFVGPALAHLEAPTDPLIVSLGSPTDAALSLLAFVEPVSFSPRVPFKHLRAFKSIHSFMTGLIVAPAHGHPSADHVEAFFTSAREHGFGGVEMLYRLVDTPGWFELLDGARRVGYEWVEYRRFVRATVEPAAGVDIEAHLTSKRRKAFRHAMRSLASLGPVEYAVVREPGELLPASERFLHLEDQGWKHERGVSLLSNSAHSNFFRAMFRSFADAGQARVCELRVGDQVVASTIHLLSTDTSFAFKLGWHNDFAKHKVGVCQQLLTAIHAARDFGDVAVIDSCTEEESFFEKLWPGRRSIASGIFVRRGLRERLVSGLKQFRQLKHFLPGQHRKENPSGDPSGH
jgi:CelD/BcsL family acetyltransferase involved in cellulose biosynthesis